MPTYLIPSIAENLLKWKEESKLYAFRICVLRCALLPKLKSKSLNEHDDPKALDVFWKSEDGKHIEDAMFWIQKDLKLKNLSSEVILRAGSLCNIMCIPSCEPILKEVTLASEDYAIYLSASLYRPVF